MKKEIDTEDTGEFDFHQLLALVQEHKEDAVKSPDEVLEAFRYHYRKVFSLDKTKQNFLLTET